MVAGAAAAVVVVAAVPVQAATVLPTVAQALPSGVKSCNVPAPPVTAPGVPWAEEYLRVAAVGQRATGAGVKIGLVDTGFNGMRDPGMASRVSVLPPVARVSGVAVRDCVGHGTALASLMVASGQGTTADGVSTGVHGLAPGASLVAIRATGDTGDTDADAIAEGITRTVTAGARIVAVPLAVPVDSTELDAAVAAAVGKGVLVVAPARLDGQTEDGPVYPAAIKGVLAVADVGPNGAVPTSTSKGAPVVLAAPGDSVVAVGPGGTGQVTGSGPSFAVGYVAAAAAVLKSYRPSEPMTTVASRLLQTAVAPTDAVPDAAVGYGILDPSAAMDTEFAGSAPVRPASAPPRATRVTPDNGLSAALVVAGVAGVVLLLALGVAVSVVARRRRLGPGGAAG